MSEPVEPPAPSVETSDPRSLSVTALYTAGVWRWAGLPGADLYASLASRMVFTVTELAIASLRVVEPVPSIKHGLVQRHFVFDHRLGEERPDTVVELAAGFSRRGAHISSGVSGWTPTTYVEVDLEDVIARKERLLRRTPEGRAVLERRGLVRRAADVSELDLTPLLGDHTVVIAEGLFAYLDARAQRDLWRQVAAALRGRRAMFLFDLVPTPEQPPKGPLGRILAWVMQRFTGGRGYVPTRTRQALMTELREAGFSDVRCIEPTALGHAGIPHLDVPTQTLVFECHPAETPPG